MKATRRQFLKAGAVVGAGAMLPIGVWRALASVTSPQTPLPGSSIPQFVEPLPTFVGSRVDSSSYVVSIQEFRQKVLPDSIYANLPWPFSGGTYVWGHRNDSQSPHWPGHTVIAHRGTPTTVKYVNNLPLPGDSRLEPLLTMDTTLTWANPHNTPPSNQPYQGTIPITTHLHGSEVLSDFDGTSNTWFTQDGIHGLGYRSLFPTDPNAAIYQYPNSQPPLTMFFHDHARGITRTNVYAGMVSQYWLRDQFDTGRADNPLRLPAGKFEIELTIQDRMFDTNGQLFYPDNDPANPLVHPFWAEEFFGDVVCVNGRSWPYFNVEPRRYRFRILNFSNMRFFRLWLEDAKTGAPGPVIWQIGTDGGLLDRPVKLSFDPNDTDQFHGTKLLMGTTERADVIIDFTGLAGHTFTLRNDALQPFSLPADGGTPPDPATVGRVMQFRVNQPLSSFDFSYNPASGAPLRGGRNQLPAIVRLADPTTGQLAPGVQPGVHRELVFIEVENDNGSIEYIINNMIMDGVRQGTNTPVADSQPDRGGQGMFLTELPRVGDTEVWEIFNLTDTTHSVHIHLIQFQVLNRQPADPDSYRTLYDTQFPGGTFFGTLPDGTPGLVDYPPGVYIPGYGPPHDYLTLNDDGAVGGNPAFSPFYQGDIHPPEPYEQGWKDSFHVLPDHVNRAVVRFSPQDIAVGDVQAGQNRFTIDPTTGPGYVWHCHMLEHEDNELMHSWICNP
jgi:spore coat protein A